MDLLNQDRKFLEAFRRGEKEALSVVFDTYAPHVIKWLQKGFRWKSKNQNSTYFRGFKEPWEIHDVLHDVFCAAFQEPSRQKYSGVVAYENYLFVIMRNTLASRFRKDEMYRKYVSNDGVSDIIDCQSLTPEEQLHRSEEKKLADGFMDGLKPDEQSLVRLRFIESLSQQKVADKMQWSRKKVRLEESKIKKKFLVFIKKKKRGGM